LIFGRSHTHHPQRERCAQQRCRARRTEEASAFRRATRLSAQAEV
jgi:hypothetical protein